MGVPLWFHSKRALLPCSQHPHHHPRASALRVSNFNPELKLAGPGGLGVPPNKEAGLSIVCTTMPPQWHPHGLPVPATPPLHFPPGSLRELGGVYTHCRGAGPSREVHGRVWSLPVRDLDGVISGRVDGEQSRARLSSQVTQRVVSRVSSISCHVSPLTHAHRPDFHLLFSPQHLCSARFLVLAWGA